MGQCGQPTKLTPEVHKGICRLLRKGWSARDAAAYWDIGESTYYQWFKFAREGDEFYAKFTRDATKARAVATGKLIRAVRKQALGTGGDGEDRIPPDGNLALKLLMLIDPRHAPKVKMIVEQEQRAFWAHLKASLSEADYERILGAVVAGNGSEGAVGGALADPREDEGI